MKHVARLLVFTKRDSIRDRISGCGQLWTKSEYAVQDDLCHSKVNNGNNGLFPTNSCFSGAFGASSRFYSSGRKGFSGNVDAEPLSRDWFVQLWRMDDMNKKVQKPKKNAGGIRSMEKSGNIYESQPVMELPFARLFRHASQGSAAVSEPVVQQKPFLQQPPLSQAATGFLKPTSSDELKLMPLLSRANLVVTRRIEWANLMLGFEQENRYAVVDPAYPESPVGFITEQSNLIFRQLLRTRRPFVAYITDAQGNELFRVRRPFWLINSTIYAEVDGKEIGVVHRRWHLWRRIYDLYLGKAQFAVVENAGFWDWTFTLKDGKGDILAQIDRDWRGIGLELFTDAGQYAIRFGHSNHISRVAAQIEELDIARPLTLSERAVALALAISLDNDYFSRHSGMGMPFFPMMGESSIIDG